ncbi:MFS transporter [Nonomuraea soli]|uniref:MFS family permease n=1 Tax=Nonomuraea soli TaxID=1032476 RepID=A0A7W0CRM9_9ACTN|nr:MFS transporter [Nonomuraea soli]MBA2896010.1 MFS family permease [Nonomuraea soli]
MTRFASLWLAELVSVVGSALTAFVLSVWVYQETGSELHFAATLLCAVVPGLIVSPVAGVIADRFDRKLMLILGDAGAASWTLVLAWLISTGQLAVWHVYVGTALGAAAAAFHLTVYQAMTPLLVPSRHLGRANGLMQASWAMQIAAPVAAGTLLESAGLRGVVLIDLASFAVAVGVVLATRLPAHVVRPEPARPPRWRADLLYGLTYLRDHGLLPLVAISAGFNLIFAAAGVLIRPLILSFASPATLGLLVFLGGAGMFAGSLVMGAWGGPRAKVAGAGAFMLLAAVALAAHGLRPSVALIAVAAPLFLFTLPAVTSCLATVIQTKTATAALGRVQATGRTLGQLAMPPAYLGAALLAEWSAEPLMRENGALAGSVGELIGTGPGRGIALLYLVFGLLMAALAAIVLLLPRLRGIEDRMPDAARDAEPSVP